jgi:hypothetical protein
MSCVLIFADARFHTFRDDDDSGLFNALWKVKPAFCFLPPWQRSQYLPTNGVTSALYDFIASARALAHSAPSSLFTANASDEHIAKPQMNGKISRA